MSSSTLLLVNPMITTLLPSIDNRLGGVNFVKDLLPLGVAVIVALAGFGFELFINYRSEKEEFRNKTKYEIYNALTKIYTEYVDNVAELQAITFIPIIIMRSSLIYGNVTQDEMDKINGQKKAIETWHKFLEQSFDKYFNYLRVWRKFSSVYENWNSVLANTQNAFTLANGRIEEMNSYVYSYLKDLRNLDTQSWMKWDEKTLNTRADDVSERILLDGIVVSDLMVILHNELIANFFGHKRKTRKPNDPDVLVLTQEGFIRGGEVDDP